MLENKLRINIDKTQFGLHEVEILGVKINGLDIIPTEKHKEKVLAYNKPRKISDVRKFLGCVNWLRSYLPNLAEKTYFLTSSLKMKDKRNWKWTDNMEKEFAELKMEITKIDKLHIIDYDKRLILRTDAVSVGVRAVLLQENEKGEYKVIEYASKKLQPSEMQYGITVKKMLGVLWGIKKFDYELRRRKFVIETDHKALKYIKD